VGGGARPGSGQADEQAEPPQRQRRDQHVRRDEQQDLHPARAVEEEEVGTGAHDVQQRLGERDAAQGDQLRQRQRLRPQPAPRASGGSRLGNTRRG
jgi:hypothetical protein